MFKYDYKCTNTFFMSHLRSVVIRTDRLLEAWGMKTIRSTSNMEMLLMFSCSNDNATKCPITANCKERDTNINQEPCT